MAAKASQPMNTDAQMMGTPSSTKKVSDGQATTTPPAHQVPPMPAPGTGNVAAQKDKAAPHKHVAVTVPDKTKS